MASTPVIPSWIRQSPSASYTSIYELCPTETRLYGTESLYGDWDGPLLLLAKDFAPACLVRRRIAAGDPRPYRHTDPARDRGQTGALTNGNLQKLAGPIPCGKLYGSALAGLLRNDCKPSGTLPELQAVMPWARRVLDFTISHMPNLRVIACLGAEAWECVTAALGRADADRDQYRASGSPLEVGRLKVFALPHPRCYPGGKDKVLAEWRGVRNALSV